MSLPGWRGSGPRRWAISLVLLMLSISVASAARAAFELRMSPANRGGAGKGWPDPRPADPGLRITTRQVRPYQIVGLRFDGLELEWGRFSLGVGQLGASAYREQSASLGLGRPLDGGPFWLRWELFRSGLRSSVARPGGVTPDGGMSLSGGLGFDLGASRWEVSALDLVRRGDADLPAVAWRIGFDWTPLSDLMVRAEREWTTGEDPWDRVAVVWKAATGAGIRFGIDDHEPLVGVELGGGGLGVRVWARNHAGFAPTTAFEVRLHLTSARDEPTSPLRSGERFRGQSSPVELPRSEMRGNSLLDTPSPWELEPEEAALQERPWEVSDSLTVWEVRADEGGEATGAAGSGPARRTVPLPGGAGGIRLPILHGEVVGMGQWPGLADSVWVGRRSAWAAMLEEGALGRLADLRRLPQEELEFWEAWVPYLAVGRGPVPEGSPRESGTPKRVPVSSFVGRMETRLRGEGEGSIRQTRWEASARSGSVRWKTTGVREPNGRTTRFSLRADHTSWKLRGDWGSVRPANGLEVGLGRSRVGDGGYLAGEVRSRAVNLGGRLGGDGADLDLIWGPVLFATSSGGLWEAGLRGDDARVEVTRSSGPSWFLRTTHGWDLADGKIVLRATERMYGAAARTRSDPRSLRFDRRVSWAQRPHTGARVRVRFRLRWRKSTADALSVDAGLHPHAPASTETRETVVGIQARSEPVPWSLDLRLRRTGSRIEGGSPKRTTSVFLGHEGRWSPGRGQPAGVGWEFGLAGTFRATSERVRSWVAVYHEVRLSRGRWAWGLCELRGTRGSRGTLDVPWSPLRPRSVPANGQWGVGTFEGRAGVLGVVASGSVPLGSPGEVPFWEVRVRLEWPFPLSTRGDPG